MAEKQTNMTSAQQAPNTLAKLMRYIKPLWGILFAVVLFSLVGSVLSIIIPTFFRDIVDKTQDGIVHGFDVATIMNDIYISLALLAGSFVCNLIQSYIAPLLSQRMAQRMRRDTNQKANKIPLNYFDTTPAGEILSTMTNDIDTLSTSFSSTLPMLVTATAMLVGCTVLMFVTNAVLAVTTIIASLLGMVLSGIILSKGAPYFKKNQDLIAELNSLVNEDIQGHLVIKAFNAEQETTKAFDDTNRELFDSTWRTQFVSALMAPLSIFASSLSYIFVCVVGAMLVFTGNTQIGTIVAFIVYAQLFATPISEIAQSAGTIQPAIAAGSRIFSVLEQDEMEDEGTTPVDTQTVRGEVDFDHVAFGYNPSNIIVHDFSCHVEPGQKVAIVGPTGAGKSTLINLLTRFYEVNDGDIRIDGTSIYDMSRETLHDTISMVLQETWTFEGTMRDNIVYSKKGVSDEEVWSVVEQCGLGDYVRASADGLDTMIGEDAGLSAGQKQLVTIARAMLDGAPILILDEATSSVDTRTEAVISAAIDKLMEGRTSFVIAHRLSTIKNADKILVLKDGDIIETGTHDELMAKGGFYADLYMSQFDTN